MDTLQKSQHFVTQYRCPSFIHLLYFILVIQNVYGLGEVIYAINAGGDSHIDVYGIRYEKDPLTNKAGTASDFGKQLIIGRVPPGDQILYQTERYHHQTFGYDIPIKGSGDYVVVLKFCEVYFNAPDQKVFDVRLNEHLTVVSSLDIFAQVGRGVAHDEYITFTVEGDDIICQGQHTPLKGNSVKVEFVKGYRDNPKVNAIYVIKGRIEDVPKLPPLPRDEDHEMGEADVFKDSRNQAGSSSKKRPSGPRTPDPYGNDDTSSMLPIFAAVGAAVPLLFCLCKL